MFKPKAKESNQPFYLSWFQHQGYSNNSIHIVSDNLKRGGTAPHESRKERIPVKSPYQQPLTTILHLNNNLYGKQPIGSSLNRNALQSNISKISKIYQGPSKSFATKRKSQEFTQQRYESELTSQQSGRGKQGRAFTQQNNQRPMRQSEQRPATQQKASIEQRTPCENLIQYMTDEEEELEQYTPRDMEDNEISQEMYVDNGDSNQSQGAESDGHESLHIEKKDELLQQNRSVVQPDGQLLNLKKTTMTASNRPQTSEGGRRKRFGNGLHPTVETPTGQQTPIAERLLLVDCRYDDEEPQVETKTISNLYSPKDITSIRSLQRRKQGEPSENKNQRPPSRHKTPPKATDLEIPNTEQETIEIPIKNMYAQMDQEVKRVQPVDDLDQFEMGYFKVNNKINLSNFQSNDSKNTYPTDHDQPHAYFAQSQNKPQSAYKKPAMQNVSYSPLNSSKSNQAKFDMLHDIVIKHNTSTAVYKNNNTPVKVPFQTSLGQDFLRLFANSNMS